MLIQEFNILNLPVNPQLILRKTGDLQPLGELYDYSSPSYTEKINDVSELSFDYTRTEENKTIYDAIKSKKIIEWVNNGRFIIDTVTEKSSIKGDIKSVTCYDLSIQFAYRYLSAINNTLPLYSLTNPNESWLGIVLKDNTDWSIGTFDVGLLDKYRTFDLTNLSYLEFVINNLAMSFECIFEFDTINKKINVTSINNKTYQTGVYFTEDNLISQLSKKEYSENIITKLSVKGDSDMDIRLVNPTGNFLYNWDYFKTTEWISQGAIDALTQYTDDIEANTTTYEVELATLLTAKGDLLNLNAELTDINTNINLEKLTLNGYIRRNDKTQSQIDEQAAVRVLIDGLLNDKNTKVTEIESKESAISNSEGILENITQLLEFYSYFDTNFNENPEYVSEIENITFVGNYNNKDYVLTDTMSTVERQEQEQLLKEQSLKVLERASKMNVEFTIDFVAFVRNIEFKSFTEQLRLSDLVYIHTENQSMPTSARIIKLVYSMDTGELKIGFSSSFSIEDSTLDLRDAVQDGINAKITLDYNKRDFEAWKANENRVLNSIESSLDLTTKAIVSSDSNDIEIDNTGITLSSLEPGQLEQLKITNSTIAFSKDKFSSSSAAIGKIVLAGAEVYGIIADVIVGKHIIGTTAHIDTSNEVQGEFRINSVEGVVIENMQLTLNKGDGSVSGDSLITMNPSSGLKIQSNTGSGLQDKLYVDLDGRIKGVSLDISEDSTFSGSTTIGQVADAGVLANKDSISYTEVTGSKPPTNADRTSTVINGGLVTTGTIELQDGNNITKAGITAKGSGDSSIRIFAGDTFTNRAIAPFKVTQGGSVYAEDITLTNPIVQGDDGVAFSNDTYVKEISDNMFIKSGNLMVLTAGVNGDEDLILQADTIDFGNANITGFNGSVIAVWG